MPQLDPDQSTSRRSVSRARSIWCSDVADRATWRLVVRHAQSPTRCRPGATNLCDATVTIPHGESDLRGSAGVRGGDVGAGKNPFADGHKKETPMAGPMAIHGPRCFFLVIQGSCVSCESESSPALTSTPLA